MNIKSHFIVLMVKLLEHYLLTYHTNIFRSIHYKKVMILISSITKDNKPTYQYIPNIFLSHY